MPDVLLRERVKVLGRQLRAVERVIETRRQRGPGRVRADGRGVAPVSAESGRAARPTRE